MDNINLIESFTELKDVKNINKSEITSLMQDVFKTVITKKYGSCDNFTIIVNPTKGDLEIWRNREIVSDDFEEFDEHPCHCGSPRCPGYILAEEHWKKLKKLIEKSKLKGKNG